MKELLATLDNALTQSMVLEHEQSEFIKISGKVYAAFQACEKLVSKLEEGK